MVLLIDNYDSFVHNLARYVRELGVRRTVVRNDAITVGDVARAAPGAHRPLARARHARRGRRLARVDRARSARRVPILGVCLGHQCIGAGLRRRGGAGGPPDARQDLRHRTTTGGVFAGLP